MSNAHEWWLKIRAVDYFENVGEWSEPVTNRLPGHGVPDTLISFKNDILFLSIDGEDQDSDSYLIDTIQTLPWK